MMVTPFTDNSIVHILAQTSSIIMRFCDIGMYKKDGMVVR
jgi:hypothetical protein